MPNDFYSYLRFFFCCHLNYGTGSTVKNLVCKLQFSPKVCHTLCFVVFALQITLVLADFQARTANKQSTFNPTYLYKLTQRLKQAACVRLLLLPNTTLLLALIPAQQLHTCIHLCECVSVFIWACEIHKGAQRLGVSRGCLLMLCWVLVPKITAVWKQTHTRTHTHTHQTQNK